MRYELADYEWAAIKTMLPNKPREVPRVNGLLNVELESRGWGFGAQSLMWPFI